MRNAIIASAVLLLAPAAAQAQALVDVFARVATGKGLAVWQPTSHLVHHDRGSCFSRS